MSEKSPVPAQQLSALYRPLSFVAVFGILTASGMLFQVLGAETAEALPAAGTTAQAYPAQTIRTALLWMLVLVLMYRLLRYCLRRSPVSFFTRQEANTAERAFSFEIRRCKACGKRRYAMLPRENGGKMVPVIPGTEVRWADIRWYCPHCRSCVGEDACTPALMKRIRPSASVCGAVQLRFGVRRSIILQSLCIAMATQVLFLVSLRYLGSNPLTVLLCLLTMYLMINYLLLFLDTALMRFVVCEGALIRRGLYDSQTFKWSDFDRYASFGAEPEERICFFTQAGNFFIPALIDDRKKLEQEILARSQVCSF